MNLRAMVAVDDVPSIYCTGLSFLCIVFSIAFCSLSLGVGDDRRCNFRKTSAQEVCFGWTHGFGVATSTVPQRRSGVIRTTAPTQIIADASANERK